MDTVVEQLPSVGAEVSYSQPKPMTNKYDRRYLSQRQVIARANAAKRAESNEIEPPKVDKLLRTIGGTKVFRELFELAKAKGDNRLAFEILRYATDRDRGKPHTAQPDGAAPKQIDNRLQVAIANLNVLATGEPKPAAKPRRQAKLKATPTPALPSQGETNTDTNS